MKNVIIKLMLWLVVVMSSNGFATAANSPEVYTFDSRAQQQRFEKVTQELRCLVCQNETLADSTAGLAKDLRDEVYQQVKQGADENTIKQYLVARYGQFILFKPAWNRLTLLLWILPFILLLVVFCVLLVFVAKHRKTAVKVELSAQEKQRLENLLR